MTPFFIKARTLLDLGPLNVFRVAWFRLGVRSGWHPVRKLAASVPSGIFFEDTSAAPVDRVVPGAWWNEALYFGYKSVPLSGEAPPDWHANLFTGARVANPERPWWQIADFDPDVGDIKVVWEASRLDWVMAFAQRAAAGDATALARLNAWLNDWCQHNPPYCGPNWKCGQEASIRVMHLAMAALILGSERALPKALKELLVVHLRRIHPTMGYAVAQDNNHGTSEAAALYIGGTWLAACHHREGAQWAAAGRKWLENRVARLFEQDGSFSQYSTTYHRVALDTLSMVELWRRRFDDAPFSPVFRQRAEAATRWLHALTQPGGDAANLGANDGANLLPLSGADYRDFRPSVQLALALFTGCVAYPESNELLNWLTVSVPEKAADAPASARLDNGGYGLLVRNDAVAFMHYPRFRFRPSQADVLHVDLWLAGENVLRDAGTYSYNVAPKWLSYFGGTEGHNTVQFDDRDQMPRLSRFLFGDWLKAREVEGPLADGDGESFAAAYVDGQGARHKRRMRLAESNLAVTDEVSGFRHKAVLRWRLKPGEWVLSDSQVSLAGHVLAISADVPLRRVELVQGWESRYYLEKTPVPVLEVEIDQPGTLQSTYSWT